VGIYPTQQIDVEQIREYKRAIEARLEEIGIATPVQMQTASYALESLAQKLRIDSRHAAIAEATEKGLVDPA